MSDTTAPEVLTEVQDGVLIVTINRPEAKNAMTRAAAEGIAAAMERLDAEDDLRVGIITGAGGTFCSGMDLKGFLRGETPSVEGKGFGGVVQAPPAKPLIAAVEGYALAGGLELMIACDLVVAHKDAKFGIPEVKRGLVAAAGGGWSAGGGIRHGRAAPCHHPPSPAPPTWQSGPRPSQRQRVAANGSRLRPAPRG